MTQFQAIPRNSKHRKAPRSTSKHLMTTCTWHVTSWLPWPWHERLTIDEHDAPSRPDQSIRAKPGRSDRSDLWLGMAWHGLAWLGTHQQSDHVWSLSSIYIILQVLCFQWKSCLSYFQTISNFMFMVWLRIWNYTSLSHHETISCSLFLHLLSDQGPILPFCFYHQDRSGVDASKSELLQQATLRRPRSNKFSRYLVVYQGTVMHLSSFKSHKVKSNKRLFGFLWALIERIWTHLDSFNGLNSHNSLNFPTM